jgi:beta-1,4-N-acetylglucosaminyltransferase
MIFVTIGTTIPFDSLIQKVDGLVEEGLISEKVICQIGNGKYVPKNCEYFRFMPNIDDLVSKSSLVVSHGGTGSVFSLLEQGKKFVAVANPDAADKHQFEFLRRLSQDIPLHWASNLSDLNEVIQKARVAEVSHVKMPSLVEDLIKYISHLC